MSAIMESEITTQRISTGSVMASCVLEIPTRGQSWTYTLTYSNGTQLHGVYLQREGVRNLVIGKTFRNADEVRAHYKKHGDIVAQKFQELSNACATFAG